MSSDSSTAGPPPPPPPATVSLPLSFANSFWSTDYRTGFTTIYDHLHSATIQSTEIIHTVKQRAQAERAMADALMPPALRGDGFALDEGASLRIGFEAVLTAQVGESRARLQLADDLLRSIATPFEAWSNSHAGRIASSRSLVHGHLAAYEKQHAQVLKLKSQYDEACRLADQAEDELNFSRDRTATTAPSEVTTEGTINEGKPLSSLLPPVPSPTISTTVPPLPLKPSSDDDDQRSEDGLSPVDDDDDDTVIPRSGLVGGASISNALGRALTTVRRKAGAPVVGLAAGSPPTEEPKQGLGLGGNEETVGKAVDWGKNTFSSLLHRVAGPQTGEERHERARKHAEEVEGKYKQAVFVLDGLRLILEQTLSEHLSYTQRCESDRLKAAASVLRSYHAALTGLPQMIQSMSERVEKTLEVVRGEKDVRGVVERKRTGPFQPRPIIFHSHYSEPFIQSFGIDLRRWAETSTSSPTSLNPSVPPILTFLLTHLTNRYPSISDAEKRKSWLYETPLVAQHHLRGLLNGRVEGWREEEVQGYDLPVVASVLKLWLLELEVPPIVYSHYEEFRHLYPKRVGQEQEQVPFKVVAEYVSRLPPVHLEVLRTLITHFSTLISTTTTTESDDVYLQKLSLSLSRCIMRPKIETAITLDDRFPALLVADLIRGKDIIFRSADELKVGRDDRYKPRRQRTKPIDVRISRSRLGLEASEGIDRESADAALLKQQQEHGVISSPPTSPPTVGGPQSILPRLSLPVSAEGENGGEPREPQQQQQQHFAASPLDMHAPSDLPPPVPIMPSVPEPSAPPAATAESTPPPPHPEPSAPPADSIDQDDVPLAHVSPISPDATATTLGGGVRGGGGGGGSITRSTRLRGARGPRPPSVVGGGTGTGAGQPAQGNVARIRDSFTRSAVGLDESEGEK